MPLCFGIMRTARRSRNARGTRRTPVNRDDARYQALVAWLGERAGRCLSWTTVSADASRRRYFRVRAAGPGATSWIAVDAPPQHENVAAFVDVATQMAAAGLHVPRVLDYDLERGFMWLTDLGERTYLQALTEHNADALFAAAIDALLDWQAASRPSALPPYDRATFAREMSLFIDWFIPHRHGRAVGHRERRRIEGAFDFLLARIVAQPPVFVHRDYMPRNLMVCEPLPGVLDFQDARYGPATYDVASLFRDAFISWPEARVRGWLRGYWERAVARGLPVAQEWGAFERDLALTGAQRHLKILGLFVRIAERDGKPRYLAELDRFVDYLRPVVTGFSELAPLAPYMAVSP